jgi:transposase InsO family protein
MQYMDATLMAGAKIKNVSEFCRINKINRRTFYRHLERIRAEGAWIPRSRRPKNSPNATPPAVVQEILRLRTALAPDNGADPIRDALHELAAAQDWAVQGLPVPSRATINRILARHDLLQRNPKKRPKASWRRFCYAQPRDCYQIDATEVVLAGGTRVVVFEVIDDHSRMLVASHAAPSETADAAIEAITKAITEYGAPAIVLCDNGTAFTSRLTHPHAAPNAFTRTVRSAGTRLIHSSPYHPQTCGKVERAHQTLKRWLAHQPTPTTLQELQTLLNTYRQHYNHRRHKALGRNTPHHTWTTAPALGGPKNPPRQTDASLGKHTVTTHGTIYISKHMRILIGREHTGTTITTVRDHHNDRITAYTPDGDPIGYLHLDHTKNWQGALQPIAA